ncbi:MAG: hypothetical protein K2Z81_04505 [Cyanobacteria bacterium]|nr:hypothetical protein [Cyanobacteriota bacterium]
MIDSIAVQPAGLSFPNKNNSIAVQPAGLVVPEKDALPLKGQPVACATGLGSDEN